VRNRGRGKAEEMAIQENGEIGSVLYGNLGNKKRVGFGIII
jgi:hypothetical protein